MLTLPCVAGAAGLRIVGPRLDRFYASPPVRVELRTASSVRAIEATLNGKGTGAAFERVGPRRWRARFGARRLRSGANHLVVSSRDGAGHRDYASTRFLVGQRRRELLSLAGPRRGRSVFARVRVAAVPRRLSAKLNGRRLRWPLGAVPGRREVLRLGADDGLRFGRNRLQVLAVRRNGAFDVERRTLFVPRDRPLAGAGRDRRTVAGSRVRLDGRSTRAAGGKGARLAYRWKIVRRPRGSRAKLRRAGSPRPLLRADRPGVYRVRLLVTEARRIGNRMVRRSAADFATVTSVENLPPIGESIETLVANGKSGGEADTGIRLGSRTYWLGLPKGNAFQALILERETLEPLYAESFSDYGSGTQTLEERIKQFGSKALVVVSVPDLTGNSPPNLGLIGIAKSLGAEVAPIRDGRPGWSVVGVPGTKGGAYLGAGSNPDAEAGGDLRGNLAGYLQQTSAGTFAFNPSSRVLFDTDASSQEGEPPQNTISVGGSKYDSQLPGCSNGGFQVLVLLAETLKPVANRSFDTNSCGPLTNVEETKAMAAFASGLSLDEGTASEGPKLVFVQSIGEALLPGTEGAGALATALEKIGATATVFATARASYALIGGVGLSRLPLVEASETLTGKAARFDGVLKPDRHGSYLPMLSSPTGTMPYPLSAIAYQPSQPWPASQSAGEKAALRYIAEDVLELEEPKPGVACYVPASGQPDVRSEYCNLEYANKWTTYAERLKKADFVAGHGFGAAEWEAVVKELADEELETVQSVWTLVGFLKEAFGTGGETGKLSLEHIAVEVEKALAPPSHTEAFGWWLELFGNLSSTGSYFSFGVDGEYVQKLLGVLQGALFESASSLYEANGEPLLESFETHAEDLVIDFAHRYVNASEAIGRVGEMLVSDSGKLQAIRHSGLLGISAGGWGRSIAAIERGTQLWGYQNLFPFAYEAVGLEPGGLNPVRLHAGEYICVGKYGRDEISYNPFSETPAGAEYRSSEPTESLGVMVLRGSKLPDNEGAEVYPVLPSAKLLKPLIEPEAGSIGYYAPWFWRSAFAYPSAKTRHVLC